MNRRPDSRRVMAIAVLVLLVLITLAFTWFGMPVYPYSIFDQMVKSWNTTFDNYYGWQCLYAIPWVYAAMLWRIRHRLSSMSVDPWPSALLLALLAMLLHGIGYRTEHVRLSMVAYFLALLSVPAVVYGRRALALLWRPHLLLISMVPLNFLDSLYFRVRSIASGMAFILSGEMGGDARLVGLTVWVGEPVHDQILLSDKMMSVSVFIYSVAFFYLVGAVCFRRWWVPFLTALIGGIAAPMVNVARQTALLTLGAAFGVETGQQLQGPMGTVFYGVGLLLTAGFMLYLGKGITKWNKTNTPKTKTTSRKPVRPTKPVARASDSY